jgi:secondary thiamine-phosphate synthase enzyme
MWKQQEILLPSFSRGFHIITSYVTDAVPDMKNFSIGMMHLFIKHTSASIAINEGADPSVRIDFETHFNKLVPENSPDFIHNAEGPDDMPAHIKSAILGSSLAIPITNGNINLGAWQDIYLCEHRNHASGRKLIISIEGILI